MKPNAHSSSNTTIGDNAVTVGNGNVYINLYINTLPWPKEEFENIRFFLNEIRQAVLGEAHAVMKNEGYDH